MLVSLKKLNSRDGEHDPLAQLSKRELEVVGLVAGGLSNKEIRARLSLEEKTVKYHMTHILSKLRVRNRTEAAILMREAGAARR
jgi:two-component system nitrate/nitrite response regulator NarL